MFFFFQKCRFGHFAKKQKMFLHLFNVCFFQLKNEKKKNDGKRISRGLGLQLGLEDGHEAYQHQTSLGAQRGVLAAWDERFEGCKNNALVAQSFFFFFFGYYIFKRSSILNKQNKEMLLLKETTPS